MEFVKDGQLVVNVYHVSTSNPITTVNLTALAQVFIDWWNTDGKTQSSAAMALDNVVVTDVSQQNGLQVQVDVSPAVPGTLVGADTPSNVAAVVSWRTGQSGRSYRGRTYWGGLIASEVSTNFISAPRIAGMLVAFASLRTAILATGNVLVVASYRANGAPRVVGTPTPINSITMDTRVDTQRRRLPFEGV